MPPWKNSECRRPICDCKRFRGAHATRVLLSATRRKSLERRHRAFTDCNLPPHPEKSAKASRLRPHASRVRSPSEELRPQQKMPDGTGPSGIIESAIKQKLNCALPFRYSLSLGFFRFRGLNGISKTPKEFGLSRRPIQTDPVSKSKLESVRVEFLLRKEVIQPQVPLRLPCYDFIPVTAHSVGRCFPCGLARALRLQVTSMM